MSAKNAHALCTYLTDQTGYSNSRNINCKVPRNNNGQTVARRPLVWGSFETFVIYTVINSNSFRSKRLGSFDDSQQKKSEPVYCCTYFNQDVSLNAASIANQSNKPNNQQLFRLTMLAKLRETSQLKYVLQYTSFSFLAGNRRNILLGNKRAITSKFSYRKIPPCTQKILAQIPY